MDEGIQMTTYQANGIEIDAEQIGDETGPPLLLIRGLGTQRTAWPEAFLAALVKRGHRVITFDNRDVGLSTKFREARSIDIGEAMGRALRGEPIDAPYGIGDMALDAAGLLDALEVETAHVAGISMGGMIAQLLAARHGERLRSLTSIMSSSGAPGLPGPTPEAAAALTSTPEDPNDRESVIRHTMQVAKVIGSPGFPSGDAYLRSVAETAYDRCYCPDGVNRQMLAVLTGGERAELLKTIRVPTLVIHGTDDPLIPVEAGVDTAKRIPGAELRLIPGMGHDIAPGLARTLADAIADHAAAVER
jgi:pimeloyl-ACP methyl ester carboxylesterase